MKVFKLIYAEVPVKQLLRPPVHVDLDVGGTSDIVSCLVRGLLVQLSCAQEGNNGGFSLHNQ